MNGGTNNVLDGLLNNSMYLSNCGICEKKNHEKVIFWPNHNGRFAHLHCHEMIQFTLQTLYNKINGLFDISKEERSLKNPAYDIAINKRIGAQIKAIEAVRSACGSDIRSYFERNGQKGLKNLCDTVGIEAALKYSNQWQSKL